jgi:hypothetical protein
MKRVALYLCTLILSMGTLSACGSPTRATKKLLHVVTSASIRVQSGFDSNERFCGALGDIQYLATGQQVALSLHLAELKADRQYSIAWQNNKVRGYTVGTFSTNDSGVVRAGSLRLFRAGEVRGIGVLIYNLVGSTSQNSIYFKAC